MPEHLPDDVDRLQRGAAADDDRTVGGELVAHDVEHSARIFELFGKAPAKLVLGRDQCRGHRRRVAPERLALGWLLRIWGGSRRAVGLRATRRLVPKRGRFAIHHWSTSGCGFISPG